MSNFLIVEFVGICESNCQSSGRYEDSVYHLQKYEKSRKWRKFQLMTLGIILIFISSR